MATRSSSAKRNGAADPALPQKKRARRRLIGATALCLLAATILPIVFDSEPRPPRDDIQVRIPSRDTPITDGGTLPQSSGTQSAEGESSPEPSRPDLRESSPRGEPVAKDAESAKSESTTPGIQAPRAERGPDSPRDPSKDLQKAPKGDLAGGDAKADSRTGSRVEPRAETRVDKRTDQKAEGRTEAKGDARSEPRFDPRTDPIAKLAETRSGAAPAKPGAYLLQTGAYANESAASEQLERLRKAGVSAYTETVKTRQGERIRVRAGPFPNRDAAEQARVRLKSAGIEAALIAPAEGR